MEEGEARGRGMSEGSTELRGTEGTFGGEKRGEECYRRCMDDAWDLKGESVLLVRVRSLRIPVREMYL